MTDESRIPRRQAQDMLLQFGDVVAEREALREALRWYAQRETYQPFKSFGLFRMSRVTPAMMDGGEKARAALEALDGNR